MKEKLTELLRVLTPHRPAAWWLLFLVEHYPLQDNWIEKIYTTIVEDIQKTEDQAKRQALEKAQSYIETIKQQEMKETVQDTKNLEELVTNLDAL